MKFISFLLCWVVTGTLICYGFNITGYATSLVYGLSSIPWLFAFRPNK